MTLYNLKRCYTLTTGTGSLTIGARILNDFTDIPDGTTVSYSITQGTISTGIDAEVGRGVYTAGTLTRATVLSSTNGGAKINCNGSAQVVVTVLAEDILPDAPSDGTTYGRKNAAWAAVSAGSGDVIDSGGVVGQLAQFVTDSKHITAAAIIPPASNILTLTNAAASTLALNITASKTLTLTAVDNYALTVPATGIAALLGTANVFTTTQIITPATDVVGLTINKSATVNSLEVKNSSLVTAFIGPLGEWKNDYRPTVLSGTVYGNYNKIFYAPSANSTVTIRGLFSEIGIASGNTKNVSVIMGWNSSIAHNGTGTIDRISALETNADNGSTGVITALYGIRVNTMSNASGSIGTLAGIKVENQTATTTVARYAIWTNKGLNLFGDQTSITGWQDVNQLIVTGFTTQTLPVGYLIDNTAATNVIRNVLQLETQSTGTAANGLGAGLLYSLETATASTMQTAAQIAAVWVDATNATRKAKLQLSAYDTAARLGMEIEASGSAVKLGFFGAATVVKPTALTTQLTTITFTAPGTPDYALQDVTNLAPYGFVDAEELRTFISVVKNLQTRVSELETKLQGLGLLT